MNKVVLTSLTMSAVLVLSGCSSSGSHKSGYNGHAAYSSNGGCANCGPGYAVQYGHNGQRSSGGGSFATAAGALLVGGLLINALGDDDSSGSHKK